MNQSVSFLANDRYKLLNTLYEHTVYMPNHSTVIPFSQTELCQLTRFGRNKVNELMNELIDSRYVIYLSRGRYTLTSRGVYIINQFKQMDEQLKDMRDFPYRVISIDIDSTATSVSA